jgi:hypothetical protein
MKNKRVLLISLAVVFVVGIFFIKSSSSIFKNEKEGAGLTVSTEVLGNLLSKDSDKDGILDWEEGLWDTNPNNKDTDGDGTPDDVEIAEMKRLSGMESEGSVDSENLTQTEQFSRELFAVVASLDQSGEIDAASVEKLTDSLATQIVNTPTKKVFTSVDIQVTENNSRETILEYNNNLNKIYQKYPIQGNVLEILQEFNTSEEENVDILLKLDPIVKQTNNLINEISKTVVPRSIANFHLDFINALQRIKENVEGLELFESDTIVTLGAVSQYETNTILLEEAMTQLANAMNEQLRILR